MMTIIDTNALLYSVNDSSSFHKKCRNYLENCLVESEYFGFTWGIVYEFFRVSTHQSVFEKPLTFRESNNFINEFLGLENFFVISETELHSETITKCDVEVLRLSGNLIHDFHTAVLMREHGIKDIVTYDTDFKAFPWVNTIEID